MKKNVEKKKINKIAILLGVILLIIAIIVGVFSLINNLNNKSYNTIEEQIGISVSKYLSISIKKYDFVSVLGDKEYGLGFYNSKEEAQATIKDSELLINVDDILFNLYKTDIKYDEYKNKMLQYISEELFENEFTKYLKNVEGYLYIIKTEDLDVYYSIDSVVINNVQDNKYEFEVSTIPSNYPVSDIYELYSGKAEKNKDGNYVITELNLREGSEEIVEDEIE